jgi:hypothetical protein
MPARDRRNLLYRSCLGIIGLEKRFGMRSDIAVEGSVSDIVDDVWGEAEAGHRSRSSTLI